MRNYKLALVSLAFLGLVGCGEVGTPTVSQIETPVASAPTVAAAAPAESEMVLTTTSTNPFASAKLWVDPNSAAAKQVAAWKTSQPANAAEIEKIAIEPQAHWTDGGDNVLPADQVAFVKQMQTLGDTPFLVVYNIPHRDCGGLASGGSTSTGNYETWINQLVSTLNHTKAIVILEPDALAGMDCLSSTDQASRLTMMSYAVTALKNEGSAVYIDAGNPLWKSASIMAGRLQQAGIARADGFALNVSNFCSNSQCTTYGDQLSAMVSGKHYVIDSSRNGLGPAPGGAWCNPPGRALGLRPTTSTGDSKCDADEWIKPPGMSDGACNGGPSWGWWPAYALGLCQRAAY